MPKRFEFSAEFEHPVERVHALLTDETYWRSRIPPESRGTVEVVGAVDGDGRPLVTVTMIETVDADSFPSLVRTVVRGEMRMQRVDSWSPVGDGRASGRVEGTSTGIPVVIDGVYELRPHRGGAVLDVRGSVTVKVPLIGGRIEVLARQMVGQMVARDRDAARHRLAEGD
ncbi:uncharacterized protein DUF2505 [Rhodococcus sp. OK519]|uniref:DUF2505 domain-containing protein n=1 Tax=Rhodococcus sp. OK519 TaxID=2135729 RepID=UPI000D363F71|nr:uncharacterized protein DUF2505 [Rhodococcus sp. OK519]